MQVARWGNSLAVRLPKRLVELRPADQLDVVAAEGRGIAIVKNERREQALSAIRARHWPLPADYRFDRDDANAR